MAVASDIRPWAWAGLYLVSKALKLTPASWLPQTRWMTSKEFNLIQTHTSIKFSQWLLRLPSSTSNLNPFTFVTLLPLSTPDLATFTAFNHRDFHTSNIIQNTLKHSDIAIKRLKRRPRPYNRT